MEVNKNGFLICPKCKNKTKVRVFPKTKLKDFPLYCSNCRASYRIDHNCQSLEPEQRHK